MADSPTRPDASPARTARQPTAGYSPTPGCLIFAIGSTVIVSLVAWFFYAGYQQTKQVETFTAPEAQTWTQPVVAPEALAALQTRLAAYGQAVEQKQPATLTLSIADLNALLAADPTLESVRRHLQMKAIGTHMVAQISFPMNRLFGDQRFLNGEIEFTPIIKPTSGIALQTDRISVPGKTVTEEFVRLYREMNFLDDMLLKGFREHPTLGPAFKQTTGVTLADGTVVVSYTPPSAPTPP